MANAESPRLQIGAWTAFKAGFFGMAGVVVANVLVGGVVLIVIAIMGVGLAGAASRFATPPNSASANPSTPVITSAPKPTKTAQR